MSLPPLVASVQKMYEAFPYPNYPLFGQPHWQDGYLSCSKFAGKLYEELSGKEAAINTARGQYVRNGRTILVAGAGEILPYIIRKNEPYSHRLLCVDLSGSNLRRARFRLRFNIRPTQFIRSDINTFLRQQAAVTGPFDHIDVYGVLHHLPDPVSTLDLLAHHLSPNGTMRVMVYNSSSRNWIHQIQAAFRLLQLNPFQKKDLKFAKEILHLMSECSPYLRQKLSMIGKGTIENDSRLVDTFLHSREARIGIARWFKIFSESRLKPYSLFDRYGELDDLENPLWKMPSEQTLIDRAEDGSFENNLEVFLCKPAQTAPRTKNYTYERKPTHLDLWQYYLKPAPHQWFSFEETEKLGALWGYRLWLKHFNTSFKVSTDGLGQLENKFPLATLQRLARLGAFFPSQVSARPLLLELHAPMEDNHYNSPQLDKANFSKNKIADLILSALKERGIFSERRFFLVLERFNRSQFKSRARSSVLDATS